MQKSLVRKIFLSAVVLSLTVSIYWAVDENGLFELGDGSGTPGSADILGDPVSPECDWADLFDSDPTPVEIKAAAVACGGVDGAFLEDDRAAGSLVDDTVFTKGSAKNDDPISSWRWGTGSVPTKDDLATIYAYATLNAQNDLILYAGMERLDPGGDSHIDFEFNQSAITLDKPAPCGDDLTAGPEDGPPCEFEGERTVGDLLVVMNFKRGGDLGILELRRWDGMQFVGLNSFGGEGCNGDDSICAFNNGGTIPGGPWPNYNSKGLTDELKRNAFTEIGVNVTQLFGGTPCFFGIQAKSRSSASFNSSLKDLGQASFDLCSLAVTKFGSTANNPDPDRSKQGDTFVFSYFFENTGVAPLELVEVVDSLLGDITTEAIAAGCGILPVGGSCGTDPQTEAFIDGTPFELVSSVPDDAEDPFDTSVQASYNPIGLNDGNEALISVAADSNFPLNLFQPSVMVEKTGDTLSTPGNVAHYTITITDTSSSDSPDLANAIVIDSLLGDLMDPANAYRTGGDCGDILPLGTSCTILAERTVLDTDPNPLPNTVDVQYNPAGGYPNLIVDSASHSVDLVYPSMEMTVVAAPAEAAPGDIVVYTYTLINTGDVDLLQIEVQDSLNGDLSALFPDVIAPGETVVVTVNYTIPPDASGTVVNESSASYQVSGLTNVITATSIFVVDVIVPCAKSPGFWKGGEGSPKWDDMITDGIAQAAGFEHATPFPWVDPSIAGSSYWDVLNLNAEGDVTRQLSFKYIAARLNQAAFGMSEGYAMLLDEIDLYLAANPVGSDPQGAAADEGQALQTRINDYFAAVGEDQCPPSEEF